MQGLVRDALRAGALGLSTNRNERHMREDGKPVASRLADDTEMFALCDVLADENAGVVETINGLNRVEHLAWYERLARHTARPVVWQNIQHRWSQPDIWRAQLDGIAPTFQAGYRAYALTSTVPLVRRFTLTNAQVFDEFVELHGDRAYRDDPAIVGGPARLNGLAVMVIGHQKGSDTESNILRNFGSPMPEGFRKAQRLMRMADRIGLPLVSTRSRLMVPG